MFAGKILPKMAPHGLASGEHCEKFSTRQILLTFMIMKIFYKVNTVFIRNTGWVIWENSRPISLLSILR